MNLGDILDGAFALFRANFRTIVIIIAVVSAPVHLISAIATRNALLGAHEVFSNNPNGTTTTSTSNSSTVSFVAALLGLLLIPYVAGAVSKVVAASYVGESLGPGPALRASLRRFLSLFAAWVLVHIAEVFGVILLIIPGLLFMSMFLMTAPVIVLEGLGPIAGMRRSSRLGKGRRWRIIGIAVLTGLVVSIIGAVVSVPFEAGAIALGATWGWILVFIGGLASSMITLSLTAIIATLIYFDGRIRKEGFDLQVLARGLDRPA